MANGKKTIDHVIADVLEDREHIALKNNRAGCQICDRDYCQICIRADCQICIRVGCQICFCRGKMGRAQQCENHRENCSETGLGSSGIHVGLGGLLSIGIVDQYPSRERRCGSWRSSIRQFADRTYGCSGRCKSGPGNFGAGRGSEGTNYCQPASAACG